MMFALMLLLGLLPASHSQGCSSKVTDGNLILILPSTLSTLPVQFKGGNGGVTINGGSGLTIKDALISGMPGGLEIDFGNSSSSSDASPACQPRSFSLFYYVALLLGTLGFVSVRRVEPVLLLVLCVALFAHGASSACPPSIVTSVPLAFLGDVKSKLAVTCSSGVQPIITVDVGPNATLTIVSCPYSATFNKAYSSPSNAASCAALGPASISVQEGANDGGLKFADKAEVSPSSSYADYTLQRSLVAFYSNSRYTLYPNVTLPTGGPFTLILDTVDTTSGMGSGLVPVILYTGTTSCKFGYKCGSGDCLSFMTPNANLCVDTGYENPVPAACASIGTTAMVCGNCTSLTCVAMCPNYDCSAVRACTSTDNGTYPCHECGCTASPCMMNSETALAPTLFLFFLSLLAILVA